MQKRVSVQDAEDLVSNLWDMLETKYPGVKFLSNPSTTNGASKRVYGRFTGRLQRKQARLVIGTEKLALARDGYVSDIDVISIVQQTFHELQHYFQNRYYMTGEVHNDMAKTMAMQSWIADVFPTFYQDNYDKMLIEIDAQRAAVEGARDYLQTNHPNLFDVDGCLVRWINNRTTWCGDRPIVVDGKIVKTKKEAIDNAITDLWSKYNNLLQCSFTLKKCPVEDRKPSCNYEYEDKFMDSEVLKERYASLTNYDKKMDFLFEYACAYGPNLSKSYPILKDRYLKWLDRVQFRNAYLHDNSIKYMIRNDENQYSLQSQDRGRMAEDKFGNIVEADDKLHNGHGGHGGLGD